MKRLSARLLASLFLLLAAVASPARAEFLDWSYHWSITPAHGITGGTGSVAFAVQPDGTGTALTPDSHGNVFVPAASVTTNSSATSANPDNFNSTYKLTLQLTDNTSNTSTNLTWTGQIKGTLTATSSQLSNTFLDPVNQQVTLNGHTYSVTMTPTLSTLPVPGSPSPGLFDAKVLVDGSSGPPPSAPEPGSLVLAGLAFSGLGLGGWWKRARRRAGQ